ncbi:NAD(P)H-dependent oxidoreductase [Streptomyces sp. NPDC057298]|uniref:NAD(P)H-dependent oxidoreductase n=1 Tax=Streptomyces sp. NPDC057298 TaxID=3346091 RepID=UPI003634CDA7
MSYLLHIDSSSLGADSVSRQVAQSFRDSWQGEVIHRDLGAAPVPHLSAAGIAARSADQAARTPEQAAAVAIQEELIGEFLGAREAARSPAPPAGRRHRSLQPRSRTSMIHSPSPAVCVTRPDGNDLCTGMRLP